MRIRTIAAAALVAAGLAVTLTGAASASTPVVAPSGDGVIITCKDGKPVERELTDADREKIEKLRERAAELGDGEHNRIRIPAEPGEPGDGEKRIQIIRGEGGEHRSPEEICADRPFD